MQRRSQVIKWQASTACDALDGSNAPKGGMALLQNLIPDPSTDGYWQARPAAIIQNALNPVFIPGFVTTGRVVGDILYGMVSAVGSLDFPFALNIDTQALITVTGTQTAATLPATQSYPWAQPAQMDIIGTKLVVAHPGFAPTAVASGNYFGWFDLTNPLAPVWHAGNLGGGFLGFLVPPIAVKQYFNRAWYIHDAVGAPALIFSDVLNATNCTNANQILTFDDINPLTALGQLPLSTLLGGQLQALIVFKGTQAMYQVTGDAALNNLQVNRLSFATGTQAPNSVCTTPKGLAFVSPDGMRIIDFSSNVSDPIGLEGAGIVTPFQQSAYLTICAACSSDVLRVSMASLSNVSTEYWYHFDAKEWTGPHTFPASLIWPWSSRGLGDTFLMQPTFASGITGIFRSDYLQYSTSTFIEKTVPIVCEWKTVLLPDSEQMNDICVTESTLDLALPSGVASLALGPTVTAADQDGTQLGQVGLLPGKTAAVQPYQLPWAKPLTFARASVDFQMDAILGFSIGALRLRYQNLRTYQNTVISSGQTSQAYTFNPLFVGTHAALSGGNLIITSTGSPTIPGSSLTTVGAQNGRYYAEFKFTVIDTGAQKSGVGVCQNTFNVNTSPGTGPADWGYFSNGQIFNNSVLVQTLGAFNVLNDIVSIAFSATEGYVWFAVNGVWQQGNPVTSTSPVIDLPANFGRIFLVAGTILSSQWQANFGASPFVYTPPQGFQAFNTINE